MRAIRDLVFLAVLLHAQSVLAVFVDVTKAAGINHVQWSPQPDRDYSEAYRMSGGAAATDYDNDGWVDLFVTRIDAPDILYRNRGNGTFEDVSATAGFTSVMATNGAAWGDIDNDGDADLYVTTIEADQHLLYINDGRGRFEEQAVLRGASLPSSHTRHGYSASFGDFDRDGYLDLHTTEWGSFPDRNGEIVTVSRLLRNRGQEAAGHFVDVTQSAGVSLTNIQGHNRHQPVQGVFSFASRFADMDQDGWPDLVVAGDFGTSRLFWNNGDGTFTDGTLAAGVGSDENGMGSAVGDYDGDGDLDWFVTAIYDENDSCATPSNGRFCNWGDSGNRLYRNDGGRLFSDQTDQQGVRDGGWGWGSSFWDYDQDGDLDLAMTNGMRLDGSPMDDPYNNDPLRLWRNDQADTGFVEIAAQEGLTDQGSGKGLLTWDYDQDGDLDLFVVNNAGTPVLFRNDQESDAAWITIDIEGTVSNRDGLGTKITIDPDLTVSGDEQLREINAGNNYLGQNESLAHFGLGDGVETIDLIQLHWSSGEWQEFHDVLVNQRFHVVESVPEPATVWGACLALVFLAIRASRRCFL